MAASAVALVCVRNELIHVERFIKSFLSNGIEVFIIDHSSEDGSRDIAQHYYGHGVVEIEDMPWAGEFSLTEQLRLKLKIISDLKHDWVIHADADEALLPPGGHTRLIETIQNADDRGFNVLNFHELVFIPAPGDDYYRPTYAREMSRYYFFQPFYPRLQRAWKRQQQLANFETGGHVLIGDDLRVYPEDCVLRHYIALSDAHVKRKYLGRRFSSADLSRGWHGNRVIIRESNLSLKSHPCIRELPYPESVDYDFSMPSKTHFWEWETAQ